MRKWENINVRDCIKLDNTISEMFGARFNANSNAKVEIDFDKAILGVLLRNQSHKY